jgi:DNA-directed RNA polymerase subunit N (RpoN/RPB10)
VPGKRGDVLITYPEDNQGHSLISCLKCGEVFAVTVAKEVYDGPPLNQKLKGLQCAGCGAPLRETYAPYPERYRDDAGNVREYERSDLILNDENSVIVELPDIYS